jgi:uncharacterized protein YdeI (YjbR/CyaY-like superfamily)
MRHTDNFYAKNIAVWRKWLYKNHDKEDSVWLIIFKQKSEVSSVYYSDFVDEASCFG